MLATAQPSFTGMTAHVTMARTDASPAGPEGTHRLVGAGRNLRLLENELQRRSARPEAGPMSPTTFGAAQHLHCGPVFAVGIEDIDHEDQQDDQQRHTT